jgi:glycosyltransferase involved in cell wall biosynthesis
MKAYAGKVLMQHENNSYQRDARPKREARALVRAGYRVSVISPMPPGGAGPSMSDDVRLYQFPAPPNAGGFLGYLWEYTYATIAIFVLSIVVLLREGFDILHAHNPPDTLALIAAPYKLLGKRLVYDHHDLAPEMYCARFRDRGNRWVYQALILLEKLSCRLADRVIATNDSYKAVEMERDGVPEEHIFVVRNAPDRERLNPVAPDPDLRGRAGTIVGYVGALGPQDGVDYLLRAAHHLIYELKRHDVLFVVIGEGDMLPELKVLAEQLEIGPYVWLTGWIPDQDLLRYLSTADICVDPDPSNPFTDRSTMVKMMEYMALGKPIVAFDLPEHRVTSGGAAVYARPNDELDFARQISALMDDPELRQKLGRMGVERVETELAWEHQEKHLLEVYETLSRG